MVSPRADVMSVPVFVFSCTHFPDEGSIDPLFPWCISPQRASHWPAAVSLRKRQFMVGKIFSVLLNQSSLSERHFTTLDFCVLFVLFWFFSFKRLKQRKK